MVNPLIIMAASLGIAFLFAWIRPHHQKIAWTLFFATLISGVVISGLWLFGLKAGSTAPNLLPGGFKAPVGIALGWGIREAFLSFLIYIGGLFGAISLYKKWREYNSSSPILYLVALAGAFGLIISRDLFNLFVFIEISTIAAAGLLMTGEGKEAIASGFKMLLATGVASVIFLIGTIFLYQLTGTLSIDQIIAVDFQGNATFFTASFLLVVAVLIKLKLWPANGWGIDLYSSAHPVVAALISTIQSGSMLYVFYKILPLVPSGAIPVLMWTGAITFVLGHLAGLRQEDFQRMLAYSSVGMMGLMVTAISWLTQRYGTHIPVYLEVTILGGFFLTHILAKGGLFGMMAHYSDEKGVFNISSLGSTMFGTVVVSALIMALSGLPPFPSFWSKWTLLRELASTDITILSTLLLGALFEVVNLFRWLGRALEGESHCAIHASPVLSGLAVIALILPLAIIPQPQLSSWILLPVAVAALCAIFVRFSYRIQTVISLLILGLVGWQMWPMAEGLGQAFFTMILGVGGVLLLAGFRKDQKANGQLPLITATIVSVASLALSRTVLDFWTAWELMTLFSALLILRGRKAKKSALQYWTFSMTGAYLLLTGLVLAAAGSIDLSLSSVLGNASPIAMTLIALGFLIKAGAFGVHIWIPGAYAEAEDDATTIVSSLVSKAPIWGFFILFYYGSKALLGPVDLRVALGWIGVLTALYGALLATFQEDVKKLLAYSSMGQVGYIIAAIALSNFDGWVTAIYLTVNHVLYKGLLFLTVAGVIHRVKTRNMWEMGGLIKRMPLSFVAVLMSIIAVSGVPPLTGFGGKWLMYSAFIEAGWTLQAGVAFFASAIAFLYLYRLIHTVFLGMPKNNHLDVKESSIARLIPMFILIAIIMGLSTMPKLLLEPVMGLVAAKFPATMHWDGNNLVSSLGNWNGNAIMMATMGVFMIPLIALLLRVKSVQKVKPFNIVFSGEKPESPETSHVAHNFFAHYRRALGFWVEPRATRFWNGVGEWTNSAGDWTRQWATGNGQTYMVQILLFVSVLYLVMRQAAL